MTQTPVLSGADNFRDVAGPGYAVPGGRMRTGVLFRANRLALEPDDVAVLSALGLSAVHDLREQWEIDYHRDTEVPGARWRHYEVPGTNIEELQSLTSPAETDALMRRHYRGMVSEPRRVAGLRSALGAIVEGLRAGDAPQVFHCSAGKDRTGWLAALIQHAVGVGWDDVVRDFVLTDERSAGSRSRNVEMIAALWGADRATILAPAFSCSVAQLDDARDEAETVFGGLEGYLREALGLGEEDHELLVRRLVVAD